MIDVFGEYEKKKAMEARKRSRDEAGGSFRQCGLCGGGVGEKVMKRCTGCYLFWYCGKQSNRGKCHQRKNQEGRIKRWLWIILLCDYSKERGEHCVLLRRFLVLLECSANERLRYNTPGRECCNRAFHWLNTPIVLKIVSIRHSAAVAPSSYYLGLTILSCISCF